MHVFVTRKLPGTALDRLAVHHTVDVWPSELPPTRSELLEHVSPAHALLSMLTDPIDEALYHAAPHLRAVANYAVGYENIAVQAATGHGIAVGNVPDALTDATAQFALVLSLDLLRRVSESSHAVRSGRWHTWDPTGFLGREMRDTTVGVVGWGRIGRAYGALARALGMRVIHTGDGNGDGDEVPLEQVLAEADLLSLHVPLTPSTSGLINDGALARMRPGSLLVNTARGAVVQTRALVNALDRGHLAGAALDVTDPEPLPQDHALLSFKNVLVTPHIASASVRSRVGMADRAVDNILAALAGKRMPYCVNPDVYDSVPTSGQS